MVYLEVIANIQCKFCFMIKIFSSTTNAKNIYTATMLALLATSNSSFNTVYNEVIANIKCYIISKSQQWISTTDTRKYC